MTDRYCWARIAGLGSLFFKLLLPPLCKDSCVVNAVYSLVLQKCSIGWQMFPSFEQPAKSAFPEFLKARRALHATYENFIECPYILPIGRACSDSVPPKGSTPGLLHSAPPFRPEFKPVVRPRILPSLLDPSPWR